MQFLENNVVYSTDTATYLGYCEYYYRSKHRFRLYKTQEGKLFSTERHISFFTKIEIYHMGFRTWDSLEKIINFLVNNRDVSINEAEKLVGITLKRG